MSNLACTLCLLSLPTKSLGYSALEGATKRTVYVCNHHLENYWVTLNLWVFLLNGSLSLEALSTQSISYTTIMGALPKLKAMFFSYHYRIPGFCFNYGCAILTAT